MSNEACTDNENWVDLRVGETGLILATLESVSYGNPGHLMLRFSDWSQLVVEVQAPRNAKPIPLSTLIYVRVRRTEDGLAGIAAWVPGGAPVPLAGEY